MGNGHGGVALGELPELPPTEWLLAYGFPPDWPGDTSLARLAGRMVAQGLDREQAYQIWQHVANLTQKDPSWGWSRSGFENQWASAAAKRFGNPDLGPGALQWAAATLPQPAPQVTAGPDQAREMARQARMELDEHNATWLHDADRYQLDFCLCVAITGGSTEDGEKLWGIVVGGSSSAKSEDIRMVFPVCDAKLSDLTAAGVISWTGTGKQLKVGGLLSRLPPRSFVVIEDLAPILSDTADRSNRSKLISILRRVYDGEVQRDLGGMPGQAVWSGKVTMLAASTKVIDQQSALIDEAGPRWLLYRGRESSARTRLAGSGKRIDNAKRQKARMRAAELASQVVMAGRAAFGGTELTPQSAEQIGKIAVATGTLRGNVPRDGYGRREIIGLASTEEPWRLEAQLQLLARAAMSFGHTQASAVTMCRVVALGTVPPDRIRVVSELLVPAAAGGERNPTAIGRKREMHRIVARRALEDLRELRVTVCTNEATDDFEMLTPAVQHWELAATDEAKACADVVQADLV
jgi:hypothetical protein